MMTNYGETCRKIKDCLAKIEEARGKEKKQLVAIELFDAILENQGILRDNPRFGQTVKNKLEEFAVENDWRLEFYYLEFFGEELPSNEELRRRKLANGGKI